MSALLSLLLSLGIIKFGGTSPGGTCRFWCLIAWGVGDTALLLAGEVWALVYAEFT